MREGGVTRLYLRDCNMFSISWITKEERNSGLAAEDGDRTNGCSVVRADLDCDTDTIYPHPAMASHTWSER